MQTCQSILWYHREKNSIKKITSTIKNRPSRVEMVILEPSLRLEHIAGRALSVAGWTETCRAVNSSTARRHGMYRPMISTYRNKNILVIFWPASSHRLQPRKENKQRRCIAVETVNHFSIIWWVNIVLFLFDTCLFARSVFVVAGRLLIPGLITERPDPAVGFWPLRVRARPILIKLQQSECQWFR